MNTVLKLESMGYRFALEDQKVMIRRYGSGAPQLEAAELLKALNREEIVNWLIDRERGFTIIGEEPEIGQEDDDSRLREL